MSEYISYIFKWNALSDACTKCRELNQKQWRDQDIFQNVLWDSIWGNIWDLDAGHSLAHPHCRCQLAVRVELKASSLQQEATLLLEALRTLRYELERTA